MNKNKTEALWESFAETYKVPAEKVAQFKTYATMLQEWNEKINLTALTELSDIVSYHFADALALSHYMPLEKVHMLADVGTGAGIPALPLKIMYDDLAVVLIEVNHKRIAFLEEVVRALGLTHVHIFDLDWRTFLRQTDLPIELFVARASLQPEELLRIYKPSSAYKEAQLVYWASQQWQPTPQLQPYVNRHVTYEVGSKKRQYVFFSHPA